MGNRRPPNEAKDEEYSICEKKFIKKKVYIKNRLKKLKNIFTNKNNIKKLINLWALK